LTVAASTPPVEVRGTVSVVVALIPHTLAHTTLGARGPGATVNVEIDLIAKYVERLVTPLEAASSKER
jgi:riboflavin synthase